jgi:hypothetical protein
MAIWRFYASAFSTAASVSVEGRAVASGGRVFVADEIAKLEPLMPLVRMDGPVERIKVTSDLLREVGYDRETETLEIEFISGKIYRYHGVPDHEYETLIIAMSKGRYFQQKIDGQYRFDRVR